MAKDPKEEEHIEELLSQLQGIFGKLSKTEEDEAREKTDVPQTPPPAAPPPVEKKEPPVCTAPAPVFDTPQTTPSATPPIPEPISPPAFTATPAPPPAPAPPPMPAPTPEPVAAAPAPTAPPVLDASTIGCAVYYPATREKEAKILAQKIETMTPKFTKLAFKLQVVVVLPYDPRGEWRDTVIARTREYHARAVFVMTERMMEDAKRRATQTDLEGLQIYFQEVPVVAVEKKAFFTDVLLGMVFFFDSLKPKSPGE